MERAKILIVDEDFTLHRQVLEEARIRILEGLQLWRDSCAHCIGESVFNIDQTAFFIKVRVDAQAVRSPHEYLSAHRVYVCAMQHARKSND
jgi:hypothetical protein